MFRKIVVTTFLGMLFPAVSRAESLAEAPACHMSIPDSAMRQEAMDFIRNLPPGLQSRQESAVRQAIGGDSSALEIVRASRNRRAEPMEGVEVADLDGPYRLFSPSGVPGELPLLIYLHGGGWCFGSPDSCSAFCMSLVREGRVKVLAVDYPLAPEHPFPAPLTASVEAVRFAFENAERYGFDTAAISIGGDSAGGNLALATALYPAFSAGTDGQAVVTTDMEVLSFPLKSLLLFYPVTKVWNDGSPSWMEYGDGFGLDGSIMEAFNEAYLAGRDPAHPLISPYCASDSALAQLPPVLMINADHDILRDQGEEMCVRLTGAGTDVTHMVLPGTTHLFITVAGQPAAFSAAVKASAAFLSGRNAER